MLFWRSEELCKELPPLSSWLSTTTASQSWRMLPISVFPVSKQLKAVLEQLHNRTEKSGEPEKAIGEDASEQKQKRSTFFREHFECISSLFNPNRMNVLVLWKAIWCSSEIYLD